MTNKPIQQISNQLIRIAERISKLTSGSQIQQVASELSKCDSSTLRKINSVLLPAISQADEREKLQKEQEERLNASLSEDNKKMLELISSMEGYQAAKEMGQVESPLDYLKMLPFMQASKTRPKAKPKTKPKNESAPQIPTEASSPTEQPNASISDSANW